MVSADVE